MKYKFFLFLLLLNFNLVFPQTNDVDIMDSSNSLSRVRLSFGFVSLLSEDNDSNFKDYFFNFSYRTSGFDKTSPIFKVKMAFEPGVNGLIISHKYVDRFDLYFTPYAKFGPEIKLGQNLFLGASLGLVLITFKNSFFPLPFVGLNGFYLFELTKNFSLEVESGFHTTFGSRNLPILAYLTIGISLK